tara:strand:- start:13502 stop:13762 length:261 start_codon:yes stop_codon:yes gene_type:complete
MSWQKVDLKVNNKSIKGDFKWFDDEGVGELHIPFVKALGESLSIAKKQYKILSYEVDERDDILKIKLAMASDKGEKSNDKSIERSD